MLPGKTNQCAFLKFNPSETTLSLLNTSLSLVTTLCLTYDIYDIITLRKFFPLGRKIYPLPYGEVVAQYAFYRVFQIIYNICLLFFGIFRIVSHRVDYRVLPVFVYELFFLVTIFGSVWSMLYFFIVYFSCLSLPYFPNGTCPAEFDSITAISYTTFTVILNMVNFHSFSTPSAEGLWLVHVCFVSIVSIFVLNFLIAVLSDAYREVAFHSATTLSVQWLLITAIVEHRMPKVMSGFLEISKKKYFHYSSGRYFIKIARIMPCKQIAS